MSWVIYTLRKMSLNKLRPATSYQRTCEVFRLDLMSWDYFDLKFVFMGIEKVFYDFFSFCLKMIRVLSYFFQNFILKGMSYFFHDFILKGICVGMSCLNLRKNVNEICEKLQVCCQKALSYNFNRLVQISLYLKYDLFVQNILRVVFSSS